MSRNHTIPEDTLGGTGMSLEDFVSHARDGQYLLIVGITSIIWDYFCTFEDEWEFIWKEAPRLVCAKILFILNRYLPLFTLITRFTVLDVSLYNPSVCKFALLSATSFASVINVAIIEAVLLLLIWVLYGKKRCIGIALWTLYAVSIGIALAIKYLRPKTSLPFVKRPSHESNNCTKVTASELFFIYGVILVVESVFFTMLVCRAFKSRSSQTPILVALVKQRALYYFIILMILAVTVLAPFSGVLSWPIAHAVFIVPIASISCNRLILSLREMVFTEIYIPHADIGIPLTALSPQAHSQTSYENRPNRSIAGNLLYDRGRASGVIALERRPPDRIPRVWINGAFAPTNPDGTPWGTGPASPEMIRSLWSSGPPLRSTDFPNHFFP